MADPDSSKGSNPYESPREHGYVTPAYLAWWAWVRDRIALLVCGCLGFILFFSAVVAYLAFRDWLGR